LVASLRNAYTSATSSYVHKRFELEYWIERQVAVSSDLAVAQKDLNEAIAAQQDVE
jgi:hypothetical protein